MNSQDIIKPLSEADIEDIVRDATSPFEIVAHGTKRGFGRPVVADIMMDVGAISGIVKYEPEELVLTARAATPLSEITAALAEKNQMLGFEPCDWGPLFGAPEGQATLGGIVATNACGSRRVKAGAVRDHVIGCRFVNGKGEAIKAGGHVIKNVTGFDVAKLMCGAFGTLGVLTEITLRVTPAPARSAALVVYCSADEGLRVLREAAQLPIEPTGLAYVPKGLGTKDNDGMAVIRVEGEEEPVQTKLAELQKRFANAGDGVDAETLDSDKTDCLFRDASNGALFDRLTSDIGIWRLCVPPAKAFQAFAEMHMHEGHETPWYADWGGGLLWLRLPAREDIAARLRAIAARFGGHATLMRASPEARDRVAVFEPETPARATLTRAVKVAFDPKGLFNPGRMFQTI